jgi:predicted permease
LLVDVFIDNILPPLLIVAAGFALERAVGVDLRTLSRVAIYVFTPALILGSLIDTRMATGEVSQLVLFALAFTALMWLAGAIVTRLLGFDRRRTNAFLLTTLFDNCGNLGLAVVLFAFGEPGLERALVYFVTHSLLINTLGAYFASRGTASVRQSLANILKLPIIYAAVAALAVRGLGLGLPEPLVRAIDLPRAGAIPLMQLLLGAQLAQTSRHVDLRFVGSATAMRLVGSAAVALGLSALMGLGGLTRTVGVVQASMPSAVTVLAFSIEFGSDPEEVGSVVLLSTLASALTLTVLIALLS